MNIYILDTGILLGYVRGADYAEYIESTYSVSHPPNIALISMVTIGEILSLSLQFGWGKDKRKKLEKLLQKIPRVDISPSEILERYAEIDAYSQSKHPSKKLPKEFTSRNMGKNDIWIAATCSVLNGKLLTTDRDFDHLDKVYLDLIYIDIKSMRRNTDAR